MALRSPSYLDMETLLAHAEYAEIQIPRPQNIVEKSTRQRSGRARAGLTAVGVEGSLGRDVEYQSSYSLTPTQKAVVSKTIDALLKSDHALTPTAASVLAKDQLVELDGSARLTAVSMAGKMFHLLLRTVQESEQPMTEIDFDDLEPDFLEQAKRVYFGNELLPIPILLELEGTPLDPKVYLNLQPDHFIDSASADRVEGELRALGTVSRLIKGGDFFSSEQWLLTGYEWLLRRMLMTDIKDSIEKLVSELGVDVPTDDVHAWIAGPAIVVDVAALY